MSTGKFVVVIISENEDWNRDGEQVLYKTVDGAIGPFDTVEEATQAANAAQKQYVETEVVELTAPGGDWLDTKYPQETT